MMLMSKIKYLIVPKGTKFTGSGKLGLRHLNTTRSNRCFHLSSRVTQLSSSIILSIKVLVSALRHAHLMNLEYFDYGQKKKKKNPFNTSVRAHARKIWHWRFGISVSGFSVIIWAVSLNSFYIVSVLFSRVSSRRGDKWENFDLIFSPLLKHGRGY